MAIPARAALGGASRVKIARRVPLEYFNEFVIIVIVIRKEETNGQHLDGNQLHRFGGVGDSRSHRHHPEQEAMT